MVSVLNDPEEFPDLSALSYGRADPTLFGPSGFTAQRRAVRRLAERCLRRLTMPGLVTTSVEETVWIEEWCERRRIDCRIEEKTYPTALVGDPICFVRLGLTNPLAGVSGRRAGRGRCACRQDTGEWAAPVQHLWRDVLWDDLEGRDLAAGEIQYPGLVEHAA